MIDPKLLNVLVAIHKTRSVTRAAEQVGVSQPAMSLSLRKLREVFADPLFVKAGKVLVPTDRAEEIVADSKRVLGLLEDIAEHRASFDPNRDELSLNIEASEFTHETLLPPLMAEVARTAPRTSVTVRPLDYPRLTEALEEGMLDFAILPRHLAPDAMKMRKLFSENFVCLVRRGHALTRTKCDMRALAAQRHVRVAPVLSQGRSPADNAFKNAGLVREVALSVTSYACVPEIIAQTDLVAFYPCSMVNGLDNRFIILKSPVHTRSIEMSLVWHPRKHEALSHQWARRILVKAAGAAL